MLSAVNKGSLIQGIVTSYRLDVLALSEMWIASEDPDVIKLDAVPQVYAIDHLPRPSVATTGAGRGRRRGNGRGGGLCLIYTVTT